MALGSDELAAHQLKCEYALYKCPHPTQSDECKWEGLQTQVVPHIKEAHGDGASFVQAAPEIHPGLQRKVCFVVCLLLFLLGGIQMYADIMGKGGVQL